mmetsp:Transcript_20350/g.57918  ORF Transcript_20350/g.57918 Transcript_20350/m.57918 type:complete len:91 (+) Transcript_20350:1441-1713(+)
MLRALSPQVNERRGVFSLTGVVSCVMSSPASAAGGSRDVLLDARPAGRSMPVQLQHEKRPGRLALGQLRAGSAGAHGRGGRRAASRRRDP